jgi:hypothetical protein
LKCQSKNITRLFVFTDVSSKNTVMNNLKGIFRHLLTLRLTAFFVATVSLSIVNPTHINKASAQELPSPTPAPFLFYPSPIPFHNTTNLTENEQIIPATDLNMETQPAQEIVEGQPESLAAPEQPTIKPEITKEETIKPLPKTSAAKTPKKIISAPLPYIFKKNANGQLVCSSKNDKPHKSTRGKGIHMDMECCLDPDETPNPHCYYPPTKYGKLLKKFQ